MKTTKKPFRLHNQLGWLMSFETEIEAIYARDRANTNSSGHFIIKII